MPGGGGGGWGYAMGRGGYRTNSGFRVYDFRGPLNRKPVDAKPMV